MIIHGELETDPLDLNCLLAIAHEKSRVVPSFDEID
jgi:hypothetical protein